MNLEVNNYNNLKETIKRIDHPLFYITLILIFMISDFLLVTYFPDCIVNRGSGWSIEAPIFEELILRFTFIGLFMILFTKVDNYSGKLRSFLIFVNFLIFFFLVYSIPNLFLKHLGLFLNDDFTLNLLVGSICLVLSSYIFNRIQNKNLIFLITIIVLSNLIFALTHELCRFVGTFSFALFASLFFVNRSRLYDQLGNSSINVILLGIGYLSTFIPHFFHNNLDMLTGIDDRNLLFVLTLIVHILTILFFMYLDKNLLRNRWVVD